MRLAILMTLFLVLVGAMPQAAEIDKACSQSTGGGLTVLTQCASVYCAHSIKNSKVRDNIKFIDDTLLEYKAGIKSCKTRIDTYQRYCAALMRNYCEACAARDSVNIGVLEVDEACLKLDDVERVALSQDWFSHFAGTVSAEVNGIECAAQIYSLASSLKQEKHADTLRFASAKCHK